MGMGMGRRVEVLWMVSKLLIIVVSVMLLISTIGYALETVSEGVYTRLGNLENKVGVVDVKVDRNSDIIKIGNDKNNIDHEGIIGRLNGMSTRMANIEHDTNDINDAIVMVNQKLEKNLEEYTSASNKLDSNNKLNEVLLRGEAIQTPAKTNYIGYILVGAISGLISSGAVILVVRVSRPKNG